MRLPLISRRFGCALLVLSLAGVSHAAHPFFCTDAGGNQVALVDASGKVQWTYPAEHPQDCWVLGNGDFLFCYRGGAIELNPERRIVWEYKADPKTEVHSCQMLPDGRVLLVENGPCRLIEVDRAGHIAKEIKLTPPPATIHVHDQFRGVRKTSAGHYLVCRKGEHRIDELDGDGRTLRSIPVPGDVHMVHLLPNGHLLIACGEGRKVIELDGALEPVWQIDAEEIPGNPLRLVTGFQRLPNGNTIVCNFLGHGHIGQQPQFFEVTPDKKVVWQFTDHQHFKTINQIQVLDVPGDPVRGEILR